MNTSPTVTIKLEYDKQAKAKGVLGVVGESRLPWFKPVEIRVLIQAANAVAAGPK